MIRYDIECYISSLEKYRNISANTKASYLRDLNKLSQFAQTQYISDVAQMDASFLTDFIEDIKKKGASESSVAHTVSCMHGFFEYLVESGKIKEDFSAGIRTKTAAMGSRKKESARPMTLSEMKALFAVPDKGKKTGIRNLAMLGLLYSTGIRSAELTRVRIADIDFLIDYLTIHAEDGSTRHVPFGDKTAAVLKDYLEAYRSSFSSRSDILFRNSHGGALSRQSIWKTVKLCGEKAGIEGVVTPARLRASLEMHLTENGADPAKISMMLGKNSGISLPASKNERYDIRDYYVKLDSMF